MNETIVTPAVNPIPAAAAPAVPAVPVVPVVPAAPIAPASKTLLEQAGGEAAVPAVDVNALHEAAYAAIDARNANEDDAKDDELAEAANVAIAAAKKAALDAKSAPAVVSVPEKYEMKPGEGQTIDEALLADVTPLLKESGLSNDQLNKLAPIATKIQEKAIAAYVAQQSQAKTDRDAAEAQASKETLGAKYPEQLALVAKARDRFFSAESKAILTEHGNNIHLIQDLVKLGTLISEGKFVDGKSAGVPKTPGAVLFENTK